ncbi:MAG: hypothetical protein U0175_31520 [Caldilineaceae bacterium]
MNRLARSTALKIAAVLSFVLGLGAIYLFLPSLSRGAIALYGQPDIPPYPVVVIALALALVRIIAAYGAWQSQRWGIVFTILANGFDSVTAVPGVLYARTPALWLTAISTVILSMIVIVLCLWRERKLATT